MSPRITIPQGTTLTDFAKRMRITLAVLTDASPDTGPDDPLEEDLELDLPEGFMRAAPQADAPQDPALRHGPSASPGMNAWLALDIEHKRGQRAVAVDKTDASQDEIDALQRAWRAYQRLDPKNLRLARDMFHDLTATHGRQTRAQAFAGLGMAKGHLALWFGEDLAKSAGNILSHAAASRTAEPKYVWAHLAEAMGHALQEIPGPADVRHALDKAAALKFDAPLVAAELAHLRWRLAPNSPIQTPISNDDKQPLSRIMAVLGGEEAPKLDENASPCLVWVALVRARASENADASSTLRQLLRDVLEDAKLEQTLETQWSRWVPDEVPGASPLRSRPDGSVG